MRKIFFLTVFILTLSQGMALGETKSLVMSAYYPQPIGEYSQLRLDPEATKNLPCKVGTMYFNSEEGRYSILPGSG